MGADVPPRDHPGDVEVRAAVADDPAFLPAIELEAAAQFRGAGIDGAFLDEATPVDEFAQAQREGRLWVAVCDGRRVGFALADAIDEREAWLEEIDVLPAFGRRGIGRALVEKAVAWAGSRGFASIALSTFRDVAWNAPFYRRLGFGDVEAADYGDAVRRVLADEAARGLPVESRVVLRRRLASAARPH